MTIKGSGNNTRAFQFCINRPRFVLGLFYGTSKNA
jgi:hypothetical protein